MAWLLACLLGGLILRLVGIRDDSLWSDELYSAAAGDAPSWTAMMRELVVPDVHPPGYFALIRVVASCGGRELALRLPSALAGVASIWLTHRLAARWSPDAARWAALFATVNPTALAYSQEARPYALLLAFSLATTVLGLGALDGRRARCEVPWAYIASAIVYGYLHYFAMLHVALQLGAAFVAVPAARRRVLCAAALVALAWAPWIPVAILQSEHRHTFWAPPARASAWRAYLEFAFGGIFPSLTACVVLLRRPAQRWLWLWWWAPFVLIWLLSRGAFSLLVLRYFIAFIPAAWFLCAHALSRWPRGWSHALGVALAGTSLASWWFAPPILHREQFRELAARVCAAPVEPIVSRELPLLFDHYLHACGRRSARAGEEALALLAARGGTYLYQRDEPRELAAGLRARGCGVTWIRLSGVGALVVVAPGHSRVEP